MPKSLSKLPLLIRSLDLIGLAFFERSSQFFSKEDFGKKGSTQGDGGHA